MVSFEDLLNILRYVLVWQRIKIRNEGQVLEKKNMVTGTGYDISKGQGDERIVRVGLAGQ